jgi:3-oxoacyl-[acyl-carrier-protein] synthase II
MNQARVVVTGLGAVTPIGLGAREFWRAATAGQNGISRLTRFDPTEFSSRMAAEVKDFRPEDWIDRKTVGRLDRFGQFGLACAGMAFQDAGLDRAAFDGNRAGVIIGSGIGGSETIEAGQALLQNHGPKSLNPFFVSKLLINMCASAVSIAHGLKGPLSAPSVACSTGANAIGDAFRILQRGDADLMLAGASEACLTPLAYGGFCATRSMSKRNDQPERASRPFDKDRDGFVMGEGAGVAVLENREHARRRQARIYAEIVGYGNAADAHHITSPDPAGDGMVRVMNRALADAGIAPADVGYINAHGTSTVLNDKIESRAIETVFGEQARRLKVSSIKSMIGHLMAAAGAVAFISSALSLWSGLIPPTINCDEPDPECRLDYVRHGAERVPLETVLTNSFGFGGGNACLVLRKYREES